MDGLPFIPRVILPYSGRAPSLIPIPGKTLQTELRSHAEGTEGTENAISPLFPLFPLGENGFFSRIWN